MYAPWFGRQGSRPQWVDLWARLWTLPFAPFGPHGPMRRVRAGRAAAARRGPLRRVLGGRGMHRDTVAYSVVGAPNR